MGKGSEDTTQRKKNSQQIPEKMPRSPASRECKSGIRIRELTQDRLFYKNKITDAGQTAEKEGTDILLAGMKINTLIMENSMEVPKKKKKLKIGLL